MRTLRLVLAAQLVPAALLVVACGSSNSPSMQGAQTAATTTNTWVVPDTAAVLDATSRAAFTAGTLYVNAHTAANPNGEIRGQLDVPGNVRLASLDGAQETPPTTTTGFGASVITVDPTTGKVRGFILTNGLVSPTAAHIHSAAPRGTPGGILVPLTGGPDVWVVPDNAAPLTVAQIADFVAGNLYVNVHTTANPNGEIRGQLDKMGTIRLASLDGAQETPPTTSTGFGAGVLSVDITGKVAGFIQTSGLVGTAAHVHDAARGTPGGIIVPLTSGAQAAPTAAPTATTPATGLWVIPDNAPAISALQIAAFATDGLYYNVHTAANPNGEIRGQLDKTGTARVAALDGAQETPPVTTTAFGASVIAVDDGTGKVSGLLVTTGLVNPTAAHIHSAARGVPGGILVPLTGH